MASESPLKKHSLSQSKQFASLLKLIFSFCAILFIIHLFIKPETLPETGNYIENQIRSYYMINDGRSFNDTQNTTIAAPPGTKQTSLQYHVAHPLNYHFILDEPVRCGQYDPFVVLMVPVAPHQIEARNAIRSTWGNETKVQGKGVLTMFLVGLTVGSESEQPFQQKLEKESQQHRDLIQSNFVDSYFNLTIKTMVMMDWLATRCPQATYAMKIDTDMFLNVENLVTLLLAPNTPRENYLTGVLRWNRPVVRDKNSKWYVSEDMLPDSVYPTYPLGTGYVFSNDLPEKIVEISKEVPAFNIEDAYIGACIKKLGFEPVSPPDPSLFRFYMAYDRNEFLKIISTDVGSPQQILNIWRDVKSTV